MLDNYPVKKNMFLIYNTLLTSSALVEIVERLFSFATIIINAPKRNSLSETNFETLVLLKNYI